MDARLERMNRPEQRVDRERGRNVGRPSQLFSFWNRFLPGRFRAPLRGDDSELSPDPGTPGARGGDQVTP